MYISSIFVVDTDKFGIRYMLIREVSSAYEHLNDRFLRRVRFLFSVLGSSWFRSYVLPYLRPSWGQWPWLAPYIKKTLFTYFCGAESRERCMPVIQRLYRHGIYSVLDYAAEGALDKASFRAHTKEAAAAIDQAASEEAIAYTAIKPSALGPMEIASRREEGHSLSTTEEQQLEDFEAQMDQICAAAATARVPILIDAEDYAYQSYIDRLVLRYSASYNRSWPCVYNTFQLYLKDGYTRLERMQTEAQKQGFFLGAKLVRGAYMEKEQTQSKKLGIESPIQANKAASDEAYNKAICFVLDHIKKMGLYLGTHNESSCLLLLKEMRARQLPLDHPRVCVSQLYGMSEALSYGLVKEGLRVAKYIPYGRYEQLLPYLLRRVLENSSIRGQSSREYQAISAELQRRKQNLNK